MRVIWPGESLVLNRHISDLEIVLFRPLQRKLCPSEPEDAAPPKEASEASETVRQPSRRSSGVGDSTGPHTLSQSETMTNSTEPAVVSNMTGPPLFFDTTAGLFYSQKKMDYVGTGRKMTDDKALIHRPHAVVGGNETGAAADYSVYTPGTEATRKDGGHSATETRKASANSVAVRGEVTMAAGDGVTICLKRLGSCSGLLMCATLFSKDTVLQEECDVYYMARTPGTTVPLCLIPLRVQDAQHHSVIAVMIRQVFIREEIGWELVNVAESMEEQDVKSVVQAMQTRSLRDPAGYQHDSRVRHHSGGLSEGGEAGDSASQETESDTDDGSDDDNALRARALGEGALPTSDVSGATDVPFETLLADVPRVTRQGRRQYNVGRSHVKALMGGESTSSDDDETLDDALRAVAPHFAESGVVRYDGGAYNIGSQPAALKALYVAHREGYALHSASKVPNLKRTYYRSGSFGNANVPHDRYAADELGDEQRRPEPPPELVPLTNLKDRHKSWRAPPHRRTSNGNSKRLSGSSYTSQQGLGAVGGKAGPVAATAGKRRRKKKGGSKGKKSSRPSSSAKQRPASATKKTASRASSAAPAGKNSRDKAPRSHKRAAGVSLKAA